MPHDGLAEIRAFQKTHSRGIRSGPASTALCPEGEVLCPEGKECPEGKAGGIDAGEFAYQLCVEKHQQEDEAQLNTLAKFAGRAHQECKQVGPELSEEQTNCGIDRNRGIVEDGTPLRKPTLHARTPGQIMLWMIATAAQASFISEATELMVAIPCYHPGSWRKKREKCADYRQPVLHSMTAPCATQANVAR